MRVEKSADIFFTTSDHRNRLDRENDTQELQINNRPEARGRKTQCVQCAIETISTRTVSGGAQHCLSSCCAYTCSVLSASPTSSCETPPPHPTPPTPPADHNKQESTKRKTDKHRGGQHARRCTHRAPRTAAQKAKCTTLLSPAKRLLVWRPPE